MTVHTLGYLGVDAPDLDAWRRYAEKVLAAQVIVTRHMVCDAATHGLRQIKRVGNGVKGVTRRLVCGRWSWVH